mmetsp:Transcript_30344/g.44314  ORF Transcript_30344/g.44314 Transcript_30344/m.44314 type:complete len:233 (+) Transcript_30344:9-707(+)
MMMITTSPALRAMAMLALLSTADSFAPSAMLGSRAAVRGLRAGQRAGSVASQAAALRRAPPRACAGLRMQQEQNEGGVDPLDRFVACLPYALPLADSFEWGHYVFDAFPLATIPFLPLFPVIQLLNLPFVSFGIFIILFSFVARNPAFSRTVRFNTLQAVYLDVVLIFPQLARSIVGPSNQFVPSGLAETCANTVFYTILFSCLYSVGSNIIGKTPNQLPVISEAVEGQMPF